MTTRNPFDRTPMSPAHGFCGSSCAPAIMLAAALLLVHCGGSGSSGGGSVAPDAGSTGIGPAGGTVRSADGALTLDIPKGALPDNVDISVQPVANTAPGGAGSAYRLLPEGTTFAIPITLRFAITAADLAGTTLDGLGVGYLGADGVWRSVDAVSRDASSLRVSTTHFSDWSRLVGWQLRPPSARVGTGEHVALQVVDCEPVEDDGLVGLVPDCASDDLLTPLVVQGWAVDGIPNGNLAVGQLDTNVAAEGVSPTVRCARRTRRARRRHLDDGAAVRDCGVVVRVSAAGYAPSMARDHFFHFNDEGVGCFEGEDYPTAAGRVPYMPARGPGHLRLAEALRAGRSARCTFDSHGARYVFDVLDLTPSEIEIGPPRKA